MERTFYHVDEQAAIDCITQGREALLHHDYQTAMENFEKCYGMRITKKLAVLLLSQMANCMDKLEYYDRQQTYLEELCELELTLNNVQQLMKIYVATNNEVKRKAFAEKIKTIATKDDSEEKLAITLLAQAKDHDEIISRSLLWLKKKPDDLDVIRSVINTYIELKKIEEAYNFTQGLDEQLVDGQLYMELSSLYREMYDFETAHDYLLRHLDLHKENISGVNLVAHTLITQACYNGLLKGEDYVYWMRRAWEGTKPQLPVNSHFNINTNYFRKIRVGIISYDFRIHSVGKFVMSLFDTITNNTGIETYCYYTYPDYEDAFTAVIEERADVFKYVGRYSDKQLRKELLEDNLDILVDLNGQTAGTKIALLTERFAPVQATWMGFPFSSFYYNIDYNIGDYYFDPVTGETERYCTEKILRMDPSYMCFAACVEYHITPEPPQIQSGYITYGMMNGPHKFSGEAIGLWQKCLEATPSARLFILIADNKGAFVEKKLRERLEKFGLDLSRVDIEINVSGQPGYFGSYNKVDVMLDSFPFGGGTTTPEALWMGVPVIGCGYPMRHGRMAYAFMNQVGLGHLCADSMAAYPEKAREVAENVELLRTLRCNLRDWLKETPLFDTAVFRGAFEGAMRDTFIDYCMKNKKPFDPSVYHGNDEQLLRDCIRAADITVRELTRERGWNDRRADELLFEYVRINMLLLERLLEIYHNDLQALSIAEKVAQMVELLDEATDLTADTAKELILSIRTLLVIFT